MNYKGKLTTGEEVFLESNRQQTHIYLQGEDSSQQESQATSFETGRWSTAPTLFEAPDGVIAKVEVAAEPVFLTINSDGINQLDQAPALDGAETVNLEVTDEMPASAEIEIKALSPMNDAKPSS